MRTERLPVRLLQDVEDRQVGQLVGGPAEELRGGGVRVEGPAGRVEGPQPVARGLGEAPEERMRFHPVLASLVRDPGSKPRDDTA